MTDIERQTLETLAARASSRRVCVFGDLILDRYTWGAADRVSPEAPVPVLRWERDEDRPGGGAAVASLIAALGGRVTCVGLAADDEAGHSLARCLKRAGVDPLFVPPNDARPTTVKQRFLSRRHGHVQLLRLDREWTEPIAAPTEANLASALRQSLGAADVLAIADYGKGVCTATALRMALDEALRQAIPVLVDPARGAPFERYRGASVLLPNRLEMETAIGQPIPTPARAMALGGEWAQRWGVAAVAIKLDQDGLVWCPAAGQPRHFATRSRRVFDLTGAGDSVLATLSLVIATGSDWPLACRLATAAGGLQVERIGVAPIDWQELTDDLVSANAPAGDPSTRILDSAGAAGAAAEWRRQGQRVVFTNGCFAALHAGHVAYLREAKSLGDRLLVAINSTASIHRLKGERPVIPDVDRLRLFAALDFVDGVVLFDEDTPHALLDSIRPDLLVKGGSTSEIIGREIVEAYGGVVRTLALVDGVSTTRLLAEHDPTRPLD